MALLRSIERTVRRLVIRMLGDRSDRPIAPGEVRPERILLIRVDRIGDAVITTPTIRLLREAFHDARIDILLGEKNRAVAPLLPEISRHFVWDRHPGRLLRTVVSIRRRHYDLVVNLHLDRSSNAELATSLAAGRYVLGRSRSDTADDRHVVVETARIVTSRFGLPEITEADERECRLELRGEPCRSDREPFGRDEAEPAARFGPVGINLSAREERRRIPEETCQYVVERLCEAGLSVRLIAHPSDHERAARIAAATAGRSVTYRPTHTLPSLIDAYRTCRLVLSADSGGLHIAAASGVPVVGLYENRKKGVEWRPWGVPHRVIIGEQSVATVSGQQIVNEIVALMNETSLQPRGTV